MDEGFFRRIAARLTYANVVATMALFLALGGGAVAAFSLPEDSVKSKHIKNGAVKGPDVGRNALTGEDILEPTLQLPEGPAGERGPVGPAGSPDSPAQVLAKVSQVDGSASGLDSDLLDGLSSSAFASASDLHIVNPIRVELPPSPSGETVTLFEDEAARFDCTCIHDSGGQLVTARLEVVGAESIVVDATGGTPVADGDLESNKVAWSVANVSASSNPIFGVEIQAVTLSSQILSSWWTVELNDTNSDSVADCKVAGTLIG